MFQTHIWFGAKSIGDLTSTQLAFMTEGLNRHFREQAKAMKRRR